MPVAEFRLTAGAEPIPGYALEARLGRGGFGEVWKATAPGGFPVALKFLAVDATSSEREMRSLRMLQRVRDGHLLSIQGVWEVPGYFVLAMELADGTLLDLLTACHARGLPGVPARDLVPFFEQAAAGLDFLNAPRHVLEPGAAPVAIQHADVKPQNLLLVGSTCKLGDFGLLRCLGNAPQRTNSMTAAYASPEVFEGKPCRSSDQYSLAISWCHLRGGRLPFEGSLLQMLHDHVHMPPDLTMLPAGERAVVARALSKEPNERWPSCTAFVERLRAAGGGMVSDPETDDTEALSGGSGKPFGTPDRSEPDETLCTTPKTDASRRRSVWPRLVALAALAALTLTASTLVLAGWWVHPQLQTVDIPEADTQELAATPVPEPTPTFIPSPGPGPGSTVFREVKRPAVTPSPLPTPHFTPSPSPGPGPSSTGSREVKHAPLDCTTPEGVSAAEVRQVQRSWARTLGRPVEENVAVGDGIKMTFILIPPGRFRMGSPTGEVNRGADETLHEVTLTEPFYLAQYPVTQAQYQALTGHNPSQFKGPDFPVEQVDWDEARSYAEKLTRKRADGYLYRLPTEAEWEYACRAGRPSSRPFGIGDGNSLSSHEANFDGNYPYGSAAKGPCLASTCRVGSFSPNAFGLSDMHGNVWQWCADWYAPYETRPVTNPTGLEDPGMARRVIRGGCWDASARSCRAAHRGVDPPGYRHENLGFRLARSLAPTGK